MAGEANGASSMSVLSWVKAVVLGLFGVVAITGLTYFNDQILRGSYLVGNNMPFSVYGTLIVFVLTVNVLLYFIGVKMALNGQQLAVAVGLSLAVCCIPGSGLYRTFPSSIIMPYQLAKTQAGWKDEKMIQLAPEGMLVDVVTEEDVKQERAARGEADDAPAVDAAPDAGTGSDTAAAATDAGPGDGLKANEDAVLGEYMQGWHIDYTETNPAPPAVAAAIDALQGKQQSRAAIYDEATGELISAAEYKSVPWYAWRPALMFWIPLILFIWLSLLGLALAVHRQWASHELLPYPIVEFTDNLLPGTTGKLASVFRERLFWLGLVVVLAIYMNNYVVVAAKISWFEIPRAFNIAPLYKLTGLNNVGQLMTIAVFFSVVAFSFMLSKEVSFSVGISPFLYALLGTVLAKQFGVTLAGGSYYEANYEKFLIFGAYFGMFAMIVYTGRHYYLRVLKQSLWIPNKERVEGHAVLGMRVFILGFALSVLMIRQVGLDWQLAVLYVAAILLMFFIMSRIIAETGLFFMQVYWLPCGVIVGLFGARALGPQSMLILFLLSMVLAVDPREAFMPFIVNALKLNDKRKVKLAPLTGWITVALIIGMAVATLVTLSLQYREGAPLQDGWATNVVPSGPFKEVLGYQQRLASQGVLEESQTVSGFARFAAIRPQKSGFLWTLLAGVLLVVGSAWGRLRSSSWPLHPVVFLVWASYPAKCFAWSFLIGWLLKVIVMKYGGAAVYQKLKPLMFGLIAGEMLGMLIPAVYSAIYYLMTGETLPGFRVMPG